MAPAMAVTAGYGPGGAAEAALLADRFVGDGVVADRRDLLFCLLDLSATLLHRLAAGCPREVALRELGLSVIVAGAAA